jgi:hypothetical protein
MHICLYNFVKKVVSNTVPTLLSSKSIYGILCHGNKQRKVSTHKDVLCNSMTEKTGYPLNVHHQGKVNYGNQQFIETVIMHC